MTEKDQEVDLEETQAEDIQEEQSDETVEFDAKTDIDEKENSHYEEEKPRGLTNETHYRN
jgi:hypothetical protein